MSILGEFQSILDDRSSRLISRVDADRVTRRRSRSRGGGDDDDEEVIVPRMEQPYRTSSSAITTPYRMKKSERARSVSPIAVKPTRKHKKGSRGHKKKSSPKHVTYDESVQVRHSDTEDSIRTEQSNRESGHGSKVSSTQCLDEPPERRHTVDYIRGYHSSVMTFSPPIKVLQPSNESDSVNFIPNSDASSQKVSSKPSNVETLSSTPSSSLPTASYPHYSRPPQPDIVASAPSSSLPAVIKPLPSHESSASSKTSQNKGRTNIKKDYIYDRTISYRAAIEAQYSDEVKRLAEANLQEILPTTINAYDGGHATTVVQEESPGVRSERSNTMPAQNLNKQMSGSRRSIGSSISKFFRKLSPGLIRQRKPIGRNMSQSLDSGSFTNNDVISRKDDGQNKSKLPQRHRHQSSSAVVQTVPTTHADYNNVANETHPRSYLSHDAPPEPRPVPNDVNSKSTSKSGGSSSVQPNQVICDQATSQPVSTRPSSSHRRQPPSSLKVSSQPRSYQTPKSESGDESIGDCSLDVNLEGLEKDSGKNLNVVSLSRQVVLSRENLVEPGLASISSKPKLNGCTSESTAPDALLNSSHDAKPNINISANTYSQSYTTPILLETSVSDLDQCPSYRVPSYLKVSCAVSGYGQFSPYSAYGGERHGSIDVAHHPSSGQNVGDGSANEVSHDQQNNQVTNLTNSADERSRVNHMVHGVMSRSLEQNPETPSKMYMKLAKSEEYRLRFRCVQVEQDIATEDIPDEVYDRMRAAIGTARLLMSKHLRTFAGFCLQESHDEDELHKTWDNLRTHIGDVDAIFHEIDRLRLNSWQEEPQLPQIAIDDSGVSTAV